MSRYDTKKCIVVVGTTRTGKSTLIKYTTTSNVPVSHGHRSHTTKSKLYSVNSNIRMLDTQGWGDSNGKSTLTIQKEIVAFLAENNTKNIQIIWTVDPGLGSTSTMRKQAKWIHKIDKNIWKSTLILCKQGTSKRSANGALGCVDDLNVSVKPLCKNLSILELCDDDDIIKESYSNKNYYQREAKGALKMREVKNWILSTMNGLNTCKISYEKYHKGPVTYVHPGQKKWKHDGEKKYYHLHPGVYSWGSGVQIGNTIFGNIATLGLMNLSSDVRRQTYSKYWSCCESYYKNSQGCCSRFDYWTCCDKGSETAKGCKFDYWTCCSQTSENAQGGEFRKYECCGSRNQNSQGCSWYIV